MRQSSNYRKIFAIAFLVFVAISSITTNAQEKSKRPNVLFAFADDWGRHASCYADVLPGGVSDIMKTPNIDRVAKQGILFTNAFVNAPSCTPCRSSLFSGRNFWETGRGAILQGATWDETIPTFPKLLQKNGYHIGFSNKAWSPGSPGDAPIGGRANRYNKKGGRFNGFSQFLDKNRSDIDAAKEKLADEVRGNFSDFIADRKETPFMYFWGPTNVHRKWIHKSGREFWGLEPEKLKGKMPAFLPDVEMIREDLADYLGEAQAFDFGLGVLLAELEKIGELENTVIIISGDHGPPGFTNGKCSLYDFGCNVPLIISMPSFTKGVNKRVVNDVVCLPELAPTILEICGVKADASMSAKSLVNVLQSEKTGKVDKDREFIVYGRERHVAVARDDYKPYPQRALRTQDYLFIRNFKPNRWPMGSPPKSWVDEKKMPDFAPLRENTFVGWPDMDASPAKAWIAHNCIEGEMRKYYDFAFGKRPARELYRVADDPYQVKNLADDPKMQEIVEELDAKLMGYLKSNDDPRVIGDGMTFERPPFTDPVKNRNKGKQKSKRKNKK